MKTKNQITRVPAASPADAVEYFERAFQFETDCWDVHHAMQQTDPEFVLLDVRSAELFAEEHVPGAHHLPHWKIDEEALSSWPADTLFVVYCAGPHCNGAARGAIRLAKLGRAVKLMAGGIEGWRDEGFEFEAGA